MRVLRHPAAPPTYAACFDPVTLSVIAIGTTVAGTAISAIGAMQQGRAQQSAANFNAAVAEQQADRERQVAEAEARDFRRDQRALQARHRALRAGSGITMAGTPLLVDEEISSEIRLGEARIRNSADARATRLRQEAQLERFSGRASRRAGTIRAGSTLLTGFGQAAQIGAGAFE